MIYQPESVYDYMRQYMANVQIVRPGAITYCTGRGGRESIRGWVGADDRWWAGSDCRLSVDREIVDKCNEGIEI